jgi:hypothetical protein
MGTLERLLPFSSARNSKFADIFAGPRGEENRLYTRHERASKSSACQRACCHTGEHCDDGYCVRTYFTRCFAPDVYDRYGGRSVTHSFAIACEPLIHQSNEPLKPLSCRYYRLYAEPGSTVEVEVRCHTSYNCHLRVALVPAVHCSHQNASVLDHPCARASFLDGTRQDDGTTRFVRTMNVPAGAEGEGHLVLIVANVYFERRATNFLPSHAYQGYSITARVVSPSPTPDSNRSPP